MAEPTAEETTIETETETKQNRADAIREAVATNAVELQAGFDTERQTLKAHNAEKVKDVGKARGRAKDAEAEAESLRLKLQAKDDGHDPEAFEAAVNKAADEKDAIRKVEWEAIQEAEATKLKTAQQELDAKTILEHDSFVGYQFVDAALGNHRPWHDGALPLIVQALAKFTHREDVAGFTVARLKTAAGSSVPGSGPDGKMTLGEYIGIQQSGKTVPGLPNIQWYLSDQQQGAAVTEVNGNEVSSKKWGDMTASERTKAISTNPADARLKISANARLKAQSAAA